MQFPQCDHVSTGWRIQGFESPYRGYSTVPWISKEKFMELAEASKGGCPISKLLNAEFTMEAKLT